MDVKALLDRLGDEFLTHSNLNPGEDTLPDDDVPHPVKVNNWANHLGLGQVSAVAVNPSDQPVVFHRGPVVWDAK